MLLKLTVGVFIPQRLPLLAEAWVHFSIAECMVEVIAFILLFFHFFVSSIVGRIYCESLLHE